MSLTDIMSAAGLSSWTELALLICLAAFVAVVVWVFGLRSARSFEHERQLPLDDERSETHREGTLP